MSRASQLMRPRCYPCRKKYRWYADQIGGAQRWTDIEFVSCTRDPKYGWVESITMRCRNCGHTWISTSRSAKSWFDYQTRKSDPKEEPA